MYTQNQDDQIRVIRPAVLTSIRQKWQCPYLGLMHHVRAAAPINKRVKYRPQIEGVIVESEGPSAGRQAKTVSYCW